jgi:hypothetical protein
MDCELFKGVDGAFLFLIIIFPVGQRRSPKKKNEKNGI